MEDKIKRKYQEFIRSSWIYFAIGIISLSSGIYAHFFTEPEVFVNLKTQQPYMANGSILLIVGVGFTIIGFYRITNKAKAFRNEIETEEEIEEKDFVQNRSGGYTRKRIRLILRSKSRGRIK